MQARNSVFSLAANVSRLLGNLAIFVVLARVWGASGFGRFMYAFTVAGVLVRIVEYGFAVQMIRDVGRDPEARTAITGRVLGAKWLLTIPTALVAAAVCVWNPAADPHLLWFLLADAIVSSFGGTYQATLRASGHFGDDMRVSMLGSLSLFVGVSVAALAGASVYATAAAMLACRTGFLLYARGSFRARFGNLPAVERHLPTLLHALRVGLPFGAMVVLGTLATQVDTLAIRAFAGTTATGLYSAGVRMVFAGLLLTDALHAVYLTYVVQPTTTSRDQWVAGERMLRLLGAFALLCAVMAALCGQFFVVGIFGSTFRPLAPLLGGFCLLLATRSVAAPYGALLVRMDRQGIRLAGAAVALSVGTIINVLLTPLWGVRGALLGAIVSEGCVIGAYAFIVRGQLPRTLLTPRVTTLLGATAAMALVPLAPLSPGWRACGSLLAAAGLPLVALTGPERTELRARGAPYLRRAVALVGSGARRCGDHLEAALSWLLTWVVRRDDDLWVFGSSYGRRFADNAKHAYLAAIATRAARAVWITQSREVADQLRAEGLPVLRARSLAGRWAMLKAGVWWCDCRIMDIGYISRRGALVVNLWHGVPLKKIEADIDHSGHPCHRAQHGRWWERAWARLAHPQLSERYDVVPATGAACAERLRTAFRLPAHAVPQTGFPRNDVLTGVRWDAAGDRPTRVACATLLEDAALGFTTILYMPTFRDVRGPDSDIPLDWPALDRECASRGWRFYVKLHPSDLASLPNLAALQQIRVLAPEIDVYPLLPHVQALVTDYSSIYFDYLLLDRPVVHFAYDLPSYVARSRALYEPFEQAIAGPVVRTQSELVSALEGEIAGGHAATRELRERTRARVHQAPGGAALALFQIARANRRR